MVDFLHGRETLMTEHTSLPTFDYAQGYPRKYAVPARMTVLPLAERKLALVSPVPIDDAVARALAELGEVELLIAPNLLHHLHLSAAAQRYPRARVLAPPRLAAKQPGLRIDATLDRELPALLTDAVQVLHIAGAPRVDEYVFFHRATRTLVVTELVFNMVEPRGLLPNVVLFVMGVHGRLAQSRAWRLLVRDRAAAAASARRVLALPIQTLVVAHGEIVVHDAKAKLAAALRWLASPAPALPADARDDGSRARP
jgi:hypothetical protein